jgi:ClpP class serine protease
MASKADAIYAANPAAMVGSVGVVRDYRLDPSVLSITSTNAPNKRPDVSTEEGKAAVVAELDALHALFVESIAAGRKTDVKTVNNEFGRGSMLLAAAATERGMIDGLAVKTAAPSGKKPEARAMDKNELFAQHRAVYDAVLADGVAAERDRVCAHIVAAKASGLSAEAFTAIETGATMTETLRTTHMMAAASRRDVAAFAADTAAAAAAAAGADTSTAPVKTDADKVADAVADEMSGGAKSWLI